MDCDNKIANWLCTIEKKPYCLYGWIWDTIEKDFFRGWIEIENGNITAIKKSNIPPYSPLLKGIIIPGFVNYHVHVGDSIFSKKIKPLLKKVNRKELVAPPDGLKHILLKNTDSIKIKQGMIESIKKMIQYGTYSFFDFREGGIKGLNLLIDILDRPIIENMAMNSDNNRTTTTRNLIEPVIFARPNDMVFDREECLELLKFANGIGLSSYFDWKKTPFFSVARYVHENDKYFGVHVSEEQHEPFDEIVKAQPDFVVHMISSSNADWSLLAIEDIPVICCPRSNALFGDVPPIEKMAKNNVKILLGTDNTMFIEPNIFAEVLYTFQHFRYFNKNGKRGFRQCLEMALPNSFFNSLKVKKAIISEGKPAQLTVIEIPNLTNYNHPETAMMKNPIDKNSSITHIRENIILNLKK